MFIKNLLIIIVLMLFIGCNNPVDNSFNDIKEDQDSIHIVLLLENNMDTTSNTATVLHNGFFVVDIDEGIKVKVSVPDDVLVVEWTTKYIKGNDNWPYVYWLELDGSGACDTTVVDTIYPVDNSSYYIRGLEIRELF